MDIRESVRYAYSSAALDPGGKHAFPVGEEFARSLGYPADLLMDLPEEAKAAFTGVSNVSVFAEIPLASLVMDLGCGAGIDSLIARKRAGDKGRVVGIDFSEAMLERAQRSAILMGFDNLSCTAAAAEQIPVENATVDVALANGIFNLNPRRDEIFPELARVLKPGGHLYAAELILKHPLPDADINNPDSWFA